MGHTCLEPPTTNRNAFSPLERSEGGFPVPQSELQRARDRQDSTSRFQPMILASLTCTCRTSPARVSELHPCPRPGSLQGSGAGGEPPGLWVLPPRTVGGEEGGMGVEDPWRWAVPPDQSLVPQPLHPPGSSGLLGSSPDSVGNANAPPISTGEGRQDPRGQPGDKWPEAAVGERVGGGATAGSCLEAT